MGKKTEVEPPVDEVAVDEVKTDEDAQLEAELAQLEIDEAANKKAEEDDAKKLADEADAKKLADDEAAAKKLAEDSEEEDEEDDAEPLTDPINSWEDVATFLTKPYTAKEKILHLSKCDFLAASTFVSFFIDYGNKMGGAMEPVAGGRQNSRLYSQLIKAVNEKDETLFKIKFDLINLVFKENVNDSFSEFKLCRYSADQTDTALVLNTYHILSVIISSLADLAIRKKNKTAFTSFTGKDTVLTDANISRIKRYYEM